MQIPPPSGLVTLTTDFGLADPYAGVMKGMVKRHHARAEVLDFSHGVPPQDITVGAFFLRSAIGRFPTGTVHVAVVDPGVGTSRRILAVCAAECYWLAPDNGLLEAVLPHPGDEPGACEVRVVDLEAHKLVPTSRTFHGRDVLAPLAGILSSGRVGYRALGPKCAAPVRLPVEAGEGRVAHVDAFGNLITDVPGSMLEGQRSVRIAGEMARVVGTYAEGKANELIALVSSFGLVEIAVRDGNAAASLGVGAGEPVGVARD